MPTILLRIFLIYKLLNTVFAYLVPKKFKTYLPVSWYPYAQQHQQQHIKKELVSPLSSSTIPSSPSSHIPRRMDSSELRQVLLLFDKNGDGRITKNELSDSLENMGTFIAGNELSQMIENIVFNVDDVEELNSMLASLGLKQEKGVEECKKMIMRVDEDGDGRVNFTEFKEMI